MDSIRNGTGNRPGLDLDNENANSNVLSVTSLVLAFVINNELSLIIKPEREPGTLGHWILAVKSISCRVPVNQPAVKILGHLGHDQWSSTAKTVSTSPYRGFRAICAIIRAATKKVVQRKEMTTREMIK